MDEADNSIEAAYKEGYKQATVELEPEVEYWKTIAKENNKLSNKLYSGAIGFSIGVITAGVACYMMQLN